jgi:predicted RNA binding protein YcfA (HicA-like mRNA interferase family)
LKLIKRFENFLRVPVEIKYADFESILNYLGYYSKKSSGGSHEIFINENSDIQIVIPRVNGSMIKQRYIKNVIKLLNLREWFEENKESIKGKE